MAGQKHRSELSIYDDAHDDKYPPPHQVPLKVANEENVKPFGNLVYSYDKEDVFLVPWPQSGWRHLSEGTGRGGGVADASFTIFWDGDYVKGQNHAMGKTYITGRRPASTRPNSRASVLVRDLNYHPDSSQVFYPMKRSPYILLVAPPGDNVKLDDFVALYFDGSCGVNIRPNVWHEAPYPVSENRAEFFNKQGKVYGCIVVDTADEFAGHKHRSELGIYDDAHDDKYQPPHQVPLKVATEENVKPFGNLVYSYDKEDVFLVPWPQSGWRPLWGGTGRGGGVADGSFTIFWDGDYVKGQNDTMGRTYITGRRPASTRPNSRASVLVRDLNYHPDGGQVFYPMKRSPYILLVAPPGDNVKLDDFVALYFDGSCGFNINPNVWHQSPYPVSEDRAEFLNKQGKVHGCIDVDTADEFGKYLEVPLEA